MIAAPHRMASMFSRMLQHILQRVWLSRMCCLFLFHLYLSFTKVETKVLSATLSHGLSYQSHHCPMAMVHLMAVDSGHSRSVSMDVWIRSGPWKIATSRPIPQTWLGTEWRRAFMRQMYQIKCVPKVIDLAILQPDPWSESLQEKPLKYWQKAQVQGLATPQCCHWNCLFYRQYWIEAMNDFSAMMKLGTFAKRNQSGCKSTRTRTEDGSETFRAKHQHIILIWYMPRAREECSWFRLRMLEECVSLEFYTSLHNI